MKIAIVANNEHPVSHMTGYGVEAHTYTLAEGLVKKNHDVTLFASGDSETSARLVSVHPIGTALDPAIPKDQYKHYTKLLYEKAFADTNFDIIHCHDPTLSIDFSARTATSVLSTVHSPWNETRYPISLLTELSKKYINHWLIAVSEFQRIAIAKTIAQVKRVHHGIDVSSIISSDTSGNSILFLGRINERKGILDALKTAHDLNRSLHVAGFASHPEEKTLLENLRSRFSSSQITFSDKILPPREKYRLLADTKLFIFPIQWEETFGLVMIEAMATGTPVIAYARGSVPEVVEDGKTGFVVNPSDDDIRGNFTVKKTGSTGLIDAVERIYSVPEEEYRQIRRNCRQHVEKNFSADRMVANYEQVYEDILSQQSKT